MMRLRAQALQLVSCACIIASACVSACASPGLPPGGPERHTPPMITHIDPDTNSVNVRGNDFVVHFDEVVSERPAIGATIGDLFLVSPRDGEPDVSWHRSAINVHPHKGWRKNTAYTVTLLPGLTDLRGNVRAVATEVTFSTGSSIPATLLRGTMFDWISGRPVSTGYVQLRSLSDTAFFYEAATDSIGGYHLRGVPAGQYMVRGFVDQNRNRGLDPGEAYDTTRINVADTMALELLAFVHDSAGPQLSNIATTDSVTYHAYFVTPIDPRYPLTVSQFTLVGPDSVVVPIKSVAAAPPDTIPQFAQPLPPIQRPPGAVPIPTPAAPRVVKPVVLPKPARPLLYRDVIVVTSIPLHSGTAYRLQARDIVGPTHKLATSERQFTVPNFARPDSAAKKPASPALISPSTVPARPASARN